MSRRVAALAAAALAAGLAHDAAPEPRKEARAGQADRIFVGGRVWTGEPGRPLAEALAVRGTSILAVGSNGQVRAHAVKGTEIVDLRGRLVVPGFIDGHLHLLGGSLSLEELRLDDAESFAALAPRVKEWAAAHPEAHWVTGEGWAYAAFPGGLPNREQLDALVPGRPAWLVSYDGHTGWANSMALRLSGVSREAKDPPGGVVVRDEKGEPTGALEESAMDLVGRLVPKPLAHEKESALRKGIAQAAAWGLTSVHQAGIDEEQLEILFRALAAAPRLRVYVALDIQRDPAPDVLAHQEELRRRYSTDRLRVGAVKGYVDGVVEARTAAMFEPYPGGGAGLPNWTQEELDRTVAAYDKAGWQVMLHAIGDRGIDMALTAFEHAARANATSGRRHRVEHVEVPRTADLPRFKAAGVIASTQAMFPYPNRNHLEVYVPTLGPERARRALAFRSIDDAGAVQAFGSDWPVFTAEVVRGIACAVTRTTIEGTPPGGWEPTQKLTAEAALRHFTSDAAFAEHAERQKGTLAPGKLADFVVLSQDLLAVPPARIKDTKVLLTVLGGQDTWRAREF
ncbi:MAG TPA: amidohydrolase [Vicinamibacteria bacterium]|nr:amidohydrolase [Vicinamibacteria bacterium]